MGFEPTVELPPHTLSRRAPLAARTRHRVQGYADRTGRSPCGLRRRSSKTPHEMQLSAVSRGEMPGTRRTKLPKSRIWRAKLRTTAASVRRFARSRTAAQDDLTCSTLLAVQDPSMCQCGLLRVRGGPGWRSVLDIFRPGAAAVVKRTLSGLGSRPATPPVASARYLPVSKFNSRA